MALPAFTDPNDPRAKLIAIPGGKTRPISTSQSNLTAIPLQAPTLPDMMGAFRDAVRPPVAAKPFEPLDFPVALSATPQGVARQPSDPAQRLGRDQAELQRLQQGDGVSHISNAWGRGFARAGDVALSLLAPGLAATIPGFHLHNEALQRQAAGRITQDQNELQGAATLADSQAQAQQRQALAAQETAKADSLQNPKPSMGQLLYDKNGSPIGFQDGAGIYYGPKDDALPEGVRHVLAAAQRKQPTNPFELWQQTNPKGTAEEYLKLETEGKNKPLDQQMIEALESGDAHKVATISRVIQATKVQPQIQVQAATERPESTGTWTPGVGADGKPVMFNSKSGEVRPMSSDFTKGSAAGQNARIGADEQKRADLAQNLNENLDAYEDIIRRRPELFGNLSGRMTELKAKFGTSDPDITRLEAIQHQLAMVQQGVHGMRSAQGLESAAHSLTGGYHNSPEATMAALEAARASSRTFLQDSQQPGKARAVSGGDGGELPPPAVVKLLQEGVVHTFGNGQQWSLRNGKPVRVD